MSLPLGVEKPLKPVKNRFLTLSYYMEYRVSVRNEQ
jgi:hypothetical protein